MIYNFNNTYIYPYMTDIYHPYKPDIVPTWVLFLMVGLMTMYECIIIIKTIKITGYVFKYTHHIVWYMYKYLLGLTTTILITLLLKYIIAYPRPSFIDICNTNSVRILDDNIRVSVNRLNCQTTTFILIDALSSFPSGHASITAFVGMHVLNKKFPKVNSTIYAVTLIIASFICLSRVADNHHRLHEVLFGITIGLICNYIISRNNNHLESYISDVHRLELQP